MSTNEAKSKVVSDLRRKRFAFFMRDESIYEIEAIDAETALEKLGKIIGKCSHIQRHWLLQEIESCLTK